MELRVTNWEEDEPPTEESVQEELDIQDLRVSYWSSPPDDVFEGHTHGYHKILYVLEGSIKFEFPTRQKTLKIEEGNRLELPAGIRHSATVGMDGVSCMEAHIY